MKATKLKMKLGLSLIAIALLPGIVMAQNTITGGIAGRITPEATKAHILEGYGKLPLSFEANHGQTDNKVKFLSRGHGYSLFLTGNEAVIALKKTALQSEEMNGLAGRKLVEKQKMGAVGGTAVRMELVGANASPRVVGAEELPGKANYFIGNDPAKWRTNVPTYAKVKYEGVYPGVDLVYYGNQGQLEYDFVVAPGVDPSEVRLKFRGVRKPQVDEKGNLLLGSGDEEVRFEKPVVYQEVAGEKKSVEGSFVLASANRIGFQLGEYDHSQPLVIDPVLSYSTYLGGSEADAGFGIAVDTSGDAYVTGSTQSSNFPTANALQSTPGGSSGNAFVTKINASGSALVYSSYLGGNEEDDGFGIAVDTSGNAYVTGQTRSTNFPTANALQSTLGGSISAFVTKIGPSGSALVYSTYLGGSGIDFGLGIAVDTSGDAYVTGSTQSSDFPTANALQSTPGGSSGNAFVTKINASGSALVYSTYLGGNHVDQGFGIAVDASGNAYVTGLTQSSNFPTANALQSTPGGSSGNAFITKIDPSGSALVYSTYLGGSLLDQGLGIAVDTSGNAYVTGYTQSSNFPTVNALQSTLGSTYSAFVTKINASGSALVYSTFLGGSTLDSGSGIAVDTFGNAYVTGYTQSSNFPTVNALQTTLGGSIDAFVTKINASGSALVYSTYLGGSGNDIGSSVAVDTSGNAFVTGRTLSTNFPTAIALQSTLGGSIGAFDAFVSKINGTVDNIPPTTVATASPGPNSNSWNNTNVTIDLNATDNAGGSGVKQIQFALSGAENTGLQTVAGNAASVTISAEGITVLTYFATDNAGNQETAKTLTVRIDKTPPVISGLPARGCTIWPPNHKLVQVAKVIAADALSGLAPGSFKVTGTSNDPDDGKIEITGGPSQFIVQLGADKGQVYVLTATASDLAGNTVTNQTTCKVRHDQEERREDRNHEERREDRIPASPDHE
jgi:hypothetical protein